MVRAHSLAVMIRKLKHQFEHHYFAYKNASEKHPIKEAIIIAVDEPNYSLCTVQTDLGQGLQVTRQMFAARGKLMLGHNYLLGPCERVNVAPGSCSLPRPAGLQTPNPLAPCRGYVVDRPPIERPARATSSGNRCGRRATTSPGTLLYSLKSTGETKGPRPPSFAETQEAGWPIIITTTWPEAP